MKNNLLKTDYVYRLSLLVDHATGASSLKEGCLEVMVDKRTMHDDARGMGEGVLDSRLTRHRYVACVVVYVCLS